MPRQSIDPFKKIGMRTRNESRQRIRGLSRKKTCERDIACSTRENEQLATVQNIKQDTPHKIHMVKYFEKIQSGFCLPQENYSIKQVIVDRIKQFKVCKVESPFERRFTALVWHPTQPKLLAAASKGGDMFIWNHNDVLYPDSIIHGIGAGGSIQAMKFDPLNPVRVYTVCLEGKFQLVNFQTRKIQNYLSTDDYNKWYVSFDVNINGKTMVAGDNNGRLTLLTTHGEVISSYKIHETSAKVTHAEFSTQEPWLLVTSSTDHTVKLWDTRCLRQASQHKQGKPIIPLHCMQANKPVNGAYFSLTDGRRILASDQYAEIHVFRGPLWHQETTMFHPHRQFQHLTPIKAYWHPLEDIIVVGRYPDPNFPGYEPGELRTIDLFDAATGHLMHQHFDPVFTHIPSINKFSIDGETLASGCGRTLLLWRAAAEDNTNTKPTSTCFKGIPSKKKKLL